MVDWGSYPVQYYIEQSWFDKALSVQKIGLEQMACISINI